PTRRWSYPSHRPPPGCSGTLFDSRKNRLTHARIKYLPARITTSVRVTVRVRRARHISTRSACRPKSAMASGFERPTSGSGLEVRSSRHDPVAPPKHPHPGTARSAPFPLWGLALNPYPPRFFALALLPLLGLVAMPAEPTAPKGD